MASAILFCVLRSLLLAFGMLLTMTVFSIFL
jgi:hypothetical protein